MCTWSGCVNWHFRAHCWTLIHRDVQRCSCIFICLQQAPRFSSRPCEFCHFSAYQVTSDPDVFVCICVKKMATQCLHVTKATINVMSRDPYYLSHEWHKYYCHLKEKYGEVITAFLASGLFLFTIVVADVALTKNALKFENRINKCGS